MGLTVVKLLADLPWNLRWVQLGKMHIPSCPFPSSPKPSTLKTQHCEVGIHRHENLQTCPPPSMPLPIYSKPQTLSLSRGSWSQGKAVDRGAGHDHFTGHTLWHQLLTE